MMTTVESHTGTIIVKVPEVFLTKEAILIGKDILMREAFLIKATILIMGAMDIPIGEDTLTREAIQMGKGFLVQEKIPIVEIIRTIKDTLVEITPTSYLMAMLRNQTIAFVMKLRNNKAFPERDIARVKFQQVIPSQNFLTNNLVFMNPPMLCCPFCLPQFTVSLRQVSI